MQPSGQDGARAANYSSYVLALEWQPQWSLSACPGAQYADPIVVQATNGEGGTWARANLSLHGLWPNYLNPSDHDGYLWPQFCVADGFDYTTCKSNPKVYFRTTFMSLVHMHTFERIMCRRRAAHLRAHRLPYSTRAADGSAGRCSMRGED